ncbi:MAG: PHP domain-containing protein, partial [Proteobacteria bacterium]|nr:PHP domain-containing protein [Pseudomonadota bacterium]
MAYTELKSWSYYSFLRGASAPGELVEEAIRLGLQGLALTDVGGVYGLPKAFHALKNSGVSGFNLISGAQIPIAGEARSSITLIAPDRAAYGAMCRILTRSHEGVAKGTGALPREHLVGLLRSVPGADRLFLFPEWEEEWIHARAGPDSILKKWEILLEVPNRRWIFLSRHLDGLDRERTEFAKQISTTLKGPLVATQGALFHERPRQILQDVLSSVREGRPLAEMGLKLRRNAERHLKSPEEMMALFRDLPEAIRETERIREECRFSLSELRYHYPSEWIPAGFTPQSHLEQLCREGVRIRYPRGAGESVLKQLRHELGLISELGFADYFLTVHDIVSFARGRGILCQGRGSAANSVVCYVLGITAIDPVRMNLLFERFISAERGEPPDIDVDFEH